jgi:PBSX family phage terminase large subunit
MLDFSLHYKQSLLFTSKANEILFGGAAGGGKSYAIRVLAIIACLQVKGLQVYVFRRNNKDLKLTHLEGRTGFRALLSSVSGVTVLQDMIRFNNGSRIYLCHADREQDVDKYRSAEIDILLIDEATTFTEYQYKFLRNRMRGTKYENIPEWLKGRLPLLIACSNPSGASFEYFRDQFVYKANPLDVHRVASDDGGMLRQYIPSLLTDNPALMKEDPSYIDRIKGLGNEALVKMYLYGDWSVQLGAYFDGFAENKHVIKPFEIPEHWLRFRALDWGSYAPSAVLWFAVSDGMLENIDKGTLIVYKELYTCTDKDTKLGTKLTADELAIKIKEISSNDRFGYTVADPSIVRRRSDIVRGDTFSDIFKYYGIPLISANNKIADGCNQIQQRLKNNKILIFSTCRHLIRTIPLMRHDDKMPEVYDSTGEDHLVDSLRYGCMSNLYVIEKEEKKSFDYTKPYYEQITYDELAQSY